MSIFYKGNNAWTEGTSSTPFFYVKFIIYFIILRQFYWINAFCSFYSLHTLYNCYKAVYNSLFVYFEAIAVS